MIQPNIKAQVLVTASLDTSILLIGDQTKFRLEAIFPESTQITFPVYAQTIIDKLEVINILKNDTVKVDEGIKVTQEYLVTSFDSGWYQIPPQNFIITTPQLNRVDTLQTNPVFFGVMTIPIDTTQANAIADIKKQIDTPITFKEVLPFFGYGFALVLILFVAYLLYMRFSKKKPVFVKKEKPKEPAHVIALRDLDALKELKLWQQGETKAFYTRLTEIIRTYIEERFMVPAMESTTDEIIDAFRKSKELNTELKNDLFDVLNLADFVKFAKAQTVATENESSLNFAYQFVFKTKPVEILRDEDVENLELKENEPPKTMNT